MELVRKNIHMQQVKTKSVVQTTLDEDINVPDSNEDIGRVIQEKTRIRIAQVKAEENQVQVRGTIDLEVLYADGREEGNLQVMKHTSLLEQMIHMEGITATDAVNVTGSVEDVSISMINSRKMNLKGIVTLLATADEAHEEDVIVEVADEKKEVQTLEKELKLLQQKVHRKDNCRIKDEIVLSSAKPNIYQLLWYQIQPVNVEIKKLSGQLSIHGEMKLFLLYSAEEEGHPLQVVEESIPFHNTMECMGCLENMISQIQWTMDQFHVEVKPDADGEERVFGIEGIMEMEIRLFEEEETRVLADAYSIKEELTPIRGELEYQTLLVKNQSKSRVSGTVSIGKNSPRILQIHQACATVRLDEVERTKEGLNAEGVLCVQLLYVTSDDEMPYASMEGQIPFQQLVEVPDMEADADYMLQTDVEQLQSMMSDSEEVEFKGVLNMDVMVLGRRKTDVIKGLETKKMDYERLQSIPGMTGYIAKDGDTLWDIAKRYSTTVTNLKEMNDFKKEEASPGDKFLILKTVSS